MNIEALPIYIYKDNQQHGPYEESLVIERLRNGQYLPSDLAIRHGGTEWQPLGAIVSIEPIQQQPQPQARTYESKQCPQCGESYEDGSSFCNNDSSLLVSDLRSHKPQLISASILFTEITKLSPPQGDYSKLSAKSKFLQDYDSHEIFQCRTKGKAIKRNLWTIAYWAMWSALAYIGILIISFFLPFAAILLGIGILINILGVIVLSLHSIIVLLSPSKTVQCPTCLAILTLRMGSEKGLCQSGHLLLLGKEIPPQLILSYCTYCNHATAVTKEFGDFVCSDCGIQRNSSKEIANNSLRYCSYCKVQLPSSVIYCNACGEFLITKFRKGDEIEDFELPYDPDWRGGKDARGHILFAAAIINGVHSRAQSGNDLKEFSIFQRELGDAIISLEHAVHEESVRRIAERVLPYLDLAYAAVLDYGCRVCDVGSYSLEQKKTIINIETSPHISAHKRLEVIYGNVWSELSCAGSWEENLISFKDFYGDGFTRKVIKSDLRLRKEAERFQAWAKKSNLLLQDKLS